MRRTLRSVLAGLAISAATTATWSVASPATADPYDDPCAASTSGTPTNPSADQAPVLHNDTVRVIRGGFAVIDVLGNDTDPDGDALTVLGASAPRYGETCIQGNKVVYFSYGVPHSTRDSFTYTVGDGDRYTTATVFIQLDSVDVKAPLVTRKLTVTDGKVSKYARVLVRNPDPDVGVRFFSGSRSGDDPTQNIYLKRATSSEFGTPLRYLQFVTVAVQGEDYIAFVNAGLVDTRTGKVHQYVTGDDFEDFRAAARLAPQV